MVYTTSTGFTHHACVVLHVLQCMIVCLLLPAIDPPNTAVSFSIVLLPATSCYNKRITFGGKDMWNGFSRHSRFATLSATSSSDLKDLDESAGNTTQTLTTGSYRNSEHYNALPKRKYPKDGVVSRLKQAAMRASAAAATEQQQENIQMKNTFFSNHSSLSSKIETMNNENKVGTLRQLTSEIDLQLHRARALPWGQYQTHMLYHNQQQRFQKQPHHISILPRDSMTAIITHNIQNHLTTKGLQLYTSTITHQPNTNMTTTTTQHVSAALATTTIRHVAILLTKRSMLNDGSYVLTVECAGRIQRLVYAMQHANYVPAVVIIIGEYHQNIDNGSKDSSESCRESAVATAAMGNHAISSDADLAYEYLMNMLVNSNDPSKKLDMSNVTFHLERSIISTQTLERIASYIQQEYVPQWLEDAIVEAESYQITTTSIDLQPLPLRPKQQQQRRWKLHVQFALVSSDYHLCIFNDIHVRSPSQSFLRALDRWTLSSVLKNITFTNRSAELSYPSNYYSGLNLETSWIYMYATTASIRRLALRTSSECSDASNKTDDDSDSSFEIVSFTSSCYQRAQDLLPVLYNLRGVVANTEFFQRDNYRVLVQARRSLVSGMERLYQQQPSLAAVHKVISPLPSSHNDRNGMPLDVVLEGALLSLGRCLDLVRPAGLLTGSVAALDFKLALMVLDQAVTQISIACDPDQPLNVTTPVATTSNSQLGSSNK
jgi:hypothetical protein